MQLPIWHGAFGGIYLPHLRNATYRELIAADSLLERATGREGAWADVSTEEILIKTLQPEVRLANDQMVAYLAPSNGGMMYELDLRAMQHNLLATMQRRPESTTEKSLRVTAQTTMRPRASMIESSSNKKGLISNCFYDVFPRKAC